MRKLQEVGDMDGLSDIGEADVPAKRGRGRPRGSKTKTMFRDGVSPIRRSRPPPKAILGRSKELEEEEPTPKRKRGRPPKAAQPSTDTKISGRMIRGRVRSSHPPGKMELGQHLEQSEKMSNGVGNAPTATFVMYSPGDDFPQIRPSLSPDDMRCLEAKFEMGGSLISIHDPTEAATWIETNWGNPLVESIQNCGCHGPIAFMLFPTTPALALFGLCDDPLLVNSAEELAELSGFPVVMRPSSDIPTGLSRETELGNIFRQGNQLSGTITNDEGEDIDMDVGGATGSSGENGHGGDDGDDMGPDGSERERERSRSHPRRNQFAAGGGDGGDGGGGTGLDGHWESQLHKTRLELRLKLQTNQTYNIAIGYNFKFQINPDTDLPIDLANLSRPLSQPEVIALVDFKIETRPRETQVDRSYANIGFVAHRKESIIEREFLHRGFDLPDKLYKRGRQEQVQRGLKATLGFSRGTPLATAAFSYDRNRDFMMEATDSKIMPRCRVDYEIGDNWNEASKSYMSYNIAYQPQDIPLEPQRSESHPYLSQTPVCLQTKAVHFRKARPARVAVAFRVIWAKNRLTLGWVWNYERFFLKRQKTRPEPAVLKKWNKLSRMKGSS
ncbi:hypothetical protein FB451DRAFT_469020 [Mycena latifolia]|nr:hypothetical protein FB451DRAFT_469020 [Mycena latifolia]